jgi:alanine dehydrogenase
LGHIIGIRREDKNKWERRVPLVPVDLEDLSRTHGLDFIAQPSAIRVFTDQEYQEAGITVAEDLSPADVIVAVKEIPIPLLQEKKVYFFFSHTIKGQSYNMPLLRRLLDLDATLIDYERIADEQGRRMIFFSLHAGYAGAIDSLWCLGRRFEHLGCETPLLELKPAHEYDSLDAAKEHLRSIGERIADGGLDGQRKPIVIGVAGYGNVARGCHEILDCLPIREISVSELAEFANATVAEVGPVLKVVFKEEDMVAPRSAQAHFVLQDYYQRPENYRSRFEDYLPHLDLLLNTIYWEEKYPRLVTRKWVRANYGADKTPRLQVIGDISCDIGGSIEITLKAPQPDDPCFNFDPVTQTAQDGVAGDGPVVMSVDNLPCELPRESSVHFSSVLGRMLPELADVDFDADFPSLNLPPHLKKAVVTHKGALTPGYRYLQEYLNKAGQ